jgi:hypothetical protein
VRVGIGANKRSKSLQFTDSSLPSLLCRDDVMLASGSVGHG